MIKIFSFQPEYFNNNGDQGNIQVLETEIAVRGGQWERVSEIGAADFVLVGDASRAAMREFQPELEELREVLKARYAAMRPTLVVGSSYEFFAADLGLRAKLMPRKSEFVESDGVFGYRNTDQDLPVLTRHGLFLATSLFGPLLAKNPGLLEELLTDLGLPGQLDEKKLEWIAQIRKRSIAG